MRSHCPNAQARSHREIQDVRKLPVCLAAALAVVDQLCAGGPASRSSPRRCCHRSTSWPARWAAFPFLWWAACGLAPAARAQRCARCKPCSTRRRRCRGAKFSQALTPPGGPGLWGERHRKRAVDLRLTNGGRPLWSAPSAGKPPPTAWSRCASCTAPCRLKTPRAASTWLAQGSRERNAALFARDHGITIVQGPALAVLLLG
jgi:hypothetical protein